MAYGQKNYNQPQGSHPKYRINQVGCFLTSFCNLLERFGRGVDPLTLNRICIDRNIYIDAAPKDGAFDDFGYQSITAMDSQIVVEQTNGTGGIPPHANAIVRIAAKNSFGTHFCLVSHIDGNTVYVIDSWDGIVRASSYYGPITGWATYRDIKPQPVQPVVPPPPPPPIAAPGSKQLFLPAAAGTWRVYTAGGPYGTNNAIGKLAPGNFPPGLTYDILGTPAPNFCRIHTETYNIVDIYTGPDTIAEFRDVPMPPPAVEAAVPAPQEPAAAVATVAPVAAPEGDIIPVTVIHTDPDAWKVTTPYDKQWDVMMTTTVKDLEGLHQDKMITKAQIGGFHSVAKFTKDGIDYVLSKRSVDDGIFYGVPLSVLEEVQAPEHDQIFQDISHNMHDDYSFKEAGKKLFSRSRLIAIVGTVFNIKDRFTSLFKGKDKVQ